MAKIPEPITYPWWPPMPTKTPHKCPVCDGRGNVPFGFYEAGWTGHYTTGTKPIPVEDCRTCNGKGVLWEP